MKNILVPVDFSKQSMEALKTAIELAKKTKRAVTMVYVLYVPLVYDTGLAGEPVALNHKFIDQMEREASEKLEKIRIKSKSGLRLKSEVLWGDISLSIMDSIQKHKSDLVVLGSSGVSGITRLMVGSVTEKVVRYSPVPVLSVWKSFQPRKIKNIVLPSTLELDQTDFIKEVKKLQESLKATLHILYINTPENFVSDNEARESFQEFIKHYKIVNYKTHLRNYRKEEEGIINFAYSERMNLIAMATHARKGLSHIFNGSITENVVNKATVPVWTYCLKAYK